MPSAPSWRIIDSNSFSPLLRSCIIRWLARTLFSQLLCQLGIALMVEHYQKWLEYRTFVRYSRGRRERAGPLALRDPRCPGASPKCVIVSAAAMKLAKNWHEIRDPIHVFIRLDHDERKVVDSRWFQRLRQIHQLALSYLVYPGATHRRF